MVKKIPADISIMPVNLADPTNTPIPAKINPLDTQPIEKPLIINLLFAKNIVLKLKPN